MKPANRPRRKEPKQPELFINRELSWLAFNQRVLEEATDTANPLLERLKFATIVASNLDEFFMVRVAALKNAIAEGDSGPDHAGLSPERQLQAISERVHEMVATLYETLAKAILPALSERGIRILAYEELEHAHRAALARHFRDEVLPALTPLAIDVSRPFPMLSTLSLNLALLLELGELAPRVLDAGIHVEAFRASHQPAAEDEKAVETTSILHGRLRALEYAICLSDLLVDAGNLFAVRSAAAAPPGRGKLLFELHTAGLLLALRKAWTRAGDKADAANCERAKARAADRPHQ